MLMLVITMMKTPSNKCMIRDSTDTELSILHLNIRSIANKFDDFNAYLDSLAHEFSVIGLSETWLNCSNLNDFPLPNYHNIGVVRTTKQGGGVGLYITNPSNLDC